MPAARADTTTRRFQRRRCAGFDARFFRASHRNTRLFARGSGEGTLPILSARHAQAFSGFTFPSPDVANSRDRDRTQKRGGGIIAEELDDNAIAEIEA